MPKQYEQIFLSSADSLDRTAVYLWQPSGRPRAVVQLVHGIREHIGRYSDFAAFLRSQGFAVCGHDHRGHGKSVTGDGAFGYFGDVDGPKQLVRDTRRVTRFIQREYPTVPIFLLGHSMGSFVARLYILHYQRELAGFLCLGTAGTNLAEPVARAASEALVRLQGPKQDGRLLDRLTFGRFDKYFPGEASQAWLSRDSQSVRDYEEDPLIRRYITNAGFRDLYDMHMAVSSRKWAQRVDPSLPILLATGSKDPVGDFGKGPVEVYERLKLAGVLDVECKIYEGARHELLNEINREELFYDLLRWMEKHID